MSVREKVGLARSGVQEYPLGIILSALELARSTWYYHRGRAMRSYEEKYAELRRPLEGIARAHPGYGYRRTVPELAERLGRVVNHKVVRKLHQCWDLPLRRATRRPKPSGVRQAIEAAGDRVNLVARLDDIGLFDVLYTDFTELVYAGGRAKAHLMVLLDHAGKLVLGHAVGERAVRELALEAWERAKRTLHRLGQPLEGLIVHHDQDSVFTSYAWTAQLLMPTMCGSPTPFAGRGTTRRSRASTGASKARITRSSSTPKTSTNSRPWSLGASAITIASGDTRAWATVLRWLSSPSAEGWRIHNARGSTLSNFRGAPPSYLNGLE